MSTIRLNKLLATRGIGARRKCDQLIESGAVRVNGEVVTAPGARVVEGRDRITVDGRPIPDRTHHRYLLLNKPVGVITTLRDPEGRRTIADLIPREGRLFPVGRLDADTSGLLIVTNDGDLAHHLMHPRYGITKFYRVLLAREANEQQLARLATGVEFEPGVRSAPAMVRRRDPVPRGAVIEIALHEGRHRQVRRMCEAVGLTVLGLHRWAYGPLKLGELARGIWRELSEAEVAALRSASARARPLPAGAGRLPRERRPVGERRDQRPAGERRPSFVAGEARERGRPLRRDERGPVRREAGGTAHRDPRASGARADRRGPRRAEDRGFARGPRRQEGRPSSRRESSPTARPFARGGRRTEARPFARGQGGPAARPFARGGRRTEARPFARGRSGPAARPFARGARRTEARPFARGQGKPGARPFARGERRPKERSSARSEREPRVPSFRPRGERRPGTPTGPQLGAPKRGRFGIPRSGPVESRGRSEPRGRGESRGRGDVPRASGKAPRRGGDAPRGRSDSRRGGTRPARGRPAPAKSRREGPRPPLQRPRRNEN